MFTINQPNGLHPSVVHANNGRAGCRGFSSGIENLKLGITFVFFSMSFSVRCVIYTMIKSTINNMSKKCHFKIQFSCILYKLAENSETSSTYYDCIHRQYTIFSLACIAPIILWTLGTSPQKTKAISSLYHTIEGCHSQGEHHKHVSL